MKKDISIKFVEIPKVNMFLHNTNINRSSTKILKSIDIDKSYPLLELVDKTCNSLKTNHNHFWNILKESWEIKKSTSSNIMNSKLEDIEDQIKKDWKLKYHKLCGAGGGGYFFNYD